MSFEIGATVTYQTLDEEYYSRGYGISMETKTSKIISICYKLANGEIVDAKKLSLVAPKEKPESKSDPTKSS